MHFCGNPLHDVPMFLWALALEAPVLSHMLIWLKGKLRRPHKHTSECSHG